VEFEKAYLCGTSSTQAPCLAATVVLAVMLLVLLGRGLTLANEF
jgi:hypothetical protein